MTRTICTVLVALYFAASGVINAEPASLAAVTMVKAYYVGWDVLTRTRLSADDVVRRSDIVVEINSSNRAENFVRWPRLDELMVRKGREPGDARLTIDIYRQDGSRSRYYADRGFLYSADSTKSRPIDQDFRDRFDIARK